jgi:hypothetical protein
MGGRSKWQKLVHRGSGTTNMVVAIEEGEAVASATRADPPRF